RGSSKILQPASRASRPEFYDFDLLTTVPRDSQELATTLEDATIVVFDTETTGLFPSSGDKIISIGAVKIRDKKIRRSEFFETLVNPERDIPESSMEFHHISNDMVKGQPVLKEVIPQFLEFSSNGILLGHNVAFDLKFLNIELEAEGKEPLSIPTLDTLLISYLLHDHFDSHNLKDIGHRLGVKVVGLHTALGDALTTAEIFIKMISLLKARGITTIGQTIEFSAKAGTLLKEQSKF
ncbi:MAG: PolC-type DNA polymerase III, partial [Nitrospinota bacterium]